MSAAVLIGVAVLGGTGAVGRFLLDTAVSRRAGRAFPFGTLTVNVAGSMALGVLAGAALSDDAYEVWGVGLIGGFTTFSTNARPSRRR